MSVTDHSPNRTDDLWARSTAPQSSYTGREIALGLVVFLIGTSIAFGLPLVLT